MGMSVEAGEFRDVMARLATGVTVVAASDPGGPACGLTASAVTAVSLGPPLVLVCVDRAADTHACIERPRAFAVNTLGEDDKQLAGRFARGGSARVVAGARPGSPLLYCAGEFGRFVP